jgi:hypothetical protein
MGGSLSTAGEATPVSRCDDGVPLDRGIKGPPPMRRVLTVEEKMWAKVRSSFYTFQIPPSYDAF